MSDDENTPSRARRLLYSIGAILTAAVAVFGLFFVPAFYVGSQVRDWFLYRASPTWPSVEGRVIQSKVIEQWDSDTNSFEYQPFITYEYEVDGQSYGSQQVQFGLVFGIRAFESRSPAESLVAKYPADSKVTVYYNPDHPGWDSVLERMYAPPEFSTFPFGFFVIVGIVVGGKLALDFVKRIYSKFLDPIMTLEKDGSSEPIVSIRKSMPPLQPQVSPPLNHRQERSEWLVVGIALLAIILFAAFVVLTFR